MDTPIEGMLHGTVAYKDNSDTVNLGGTWIYGTTRLAGPLSTTPQRNDTVNDSNKGACCEGCLEELCQHVQILIDCDALMARFLYDTIPLRQDYVGAYKTEALNPTGQQANGMSLEETCDSAHRREVPSSRWPTNGKAVVAAVRSFLCR